MKKPIQGQSPIIIRRLTFVFVITIIAGFLIFGNGRQIEARQVALETDKQETFSVKRVVDGDTLDVIIEGKTERLRLIGIDTPETVDPRKPVECFGKEASKKAKQLLSNKTVKLESDPTQGERDKYGRLLRYVVLPDGQSFNKLMISEGYAYEYTYSTPYKYQAEYKQAQKEASSAKRGLWSSCPAKKTPAAKKTSSPVTTPASVPAPPSCNIKGNISDAGKIYHLSSCGSYVKTKIDEAHGERWFCTEKEAVAAGWRKAKNCP